MSVGGVEGLGKGDRRGGIFHWGGGLYYTTRGGG